MGQQRATPPEPTAIAALVDTLCGGMEGVRLGLVPRTLGKVLPQDSPADVVGQEAPVPMLKQNHF